MTDIDPITASVDMGKATYLSFVKEVAGTASENNFTHEWNELAPEVQEGWRMAYANAVGTYMFAMGEQPTPSVYLPALKEAKALIRDKHKNSNYATLTDFLEQLDQRFVTALGSYWTDINLEPDKSLGQIGFEASVANRLDPYRWGDLGESVRASWEKAAEAVLAAAAQRQ